MSAQCERPGCDHPLPAGRRKYCSTECCKIDNHRLDRARKTNAEQWTARRVNRRAARTRGDRICLACDRGFHSAGPWNRICPRCAEAQRNRLPYGDERVVRVSAMDDRFEG